jgi:hypothetical protein
MGRAAARARRTAAALALVAVALGGCAPAPLRFRPASQPSGTPISADYGEAGGQVRVLLETGGYRVEEVGVALADGRLVAPRTVEHPGARAASGPTFGVGLGVGMGGGSWSGGGGFGITTGVGGVRGAGQVEGLTVARFDAGEIGPPPWRLRVKVVGTPAVEILLAPPGPAP